MKQMAETMDHNEFDDLKLSFDEVNRLKACFKDREFLKLFQDYVKDVTSPESKKSYEEAVISMEKERGFDVKFLHPLPCYVMKFHCETKLFINICSNEHVKEPSYERKHAGTEWKIPTILSKPREDTDKKQAKCKVVDVMFHPQTMDLAAKNKRIKNLVEDTAISMIEKQFGISLKNQPPAYPKMKYKGKAPSVVLRRNGQGDDVCKPMEDYVKELLEPKKAKTGKDQEGRDKKTDGPQKAGDQKTGGSTETDILCAGDETKLNKRIDSRKKDQTVKPRSDVPPKTVTPKYSLKYRNIVDMQDYSLMGYTDRTAPKEIVLEVQLPEVSRAGEVELEVSQRRLQLKSGSVARHKYCLELELCYSVNEKSGSAKFDKAKKILCVTLPVKERAPSGPEVCGEESANGA